VSDEPPDLPALDELPELPSLEGSVELSDEQSEVAAALAAAWRPPPQDIYGFKPAELERLIKRAAGEDETQPEALRWNPSELEQRASFGATPDGRLAAMAYALHVFRRRRELRGELLQAERARALAEAEASEALVALGETLYARRKEAARGSLAERIDKVAGAAVRVDERLSAHGTESELAAAELSDHDATIAAADRDAEPFRTRAQAAEQHVQRRQREAERAAGLHKRAEIEIRAAQSAAQPDPARIERAQALARERSGELTTAQAARVEAQAALAAAQAKLDEQLAHVASLRSRRQAAAAEHAHKSAQAQTEVNAATGEHKAALLELARAALLHNLAPKAQAEACLAVLQRANAAADEAGLMAAAPDCYDRDGNRTGLITAAGIAALVCVLLLWLAI